MQRVIPFIVAPALVGALVGVGVAYVYHVKTASRVDVIHDRTIPSLKAQATPTPRMTAPTPFTATPVPIPTPTIPPLHLGHIKFLLFTFNPQFTEQQASFTLSKPAQVSVRITAQDKNTQVRMMDLGWQSDSVVHMQWDGRDDAGDPAPVGAYSYTVTATDETGGKQTETADDLSITYKVIVVSLSQQRLTAYNGSTEVLTTLVTTGNPALPTPTGVFPILAKYSPFTFTSSRPPSSKYYYPPSPVTYALLFDDRGYYIHDAPWRHFFGPGSNAKVGTPGHSYTGSHGCVNVPLAKEQKLFKWATVGTVVQVTR